jgi:dihydroceramide fatty acyl 2-hydroxylase
MTELAPRHVARRGTTRMFESAFLERFSRAHPAMPALVYLPVVGASLYWAVAVHSVTLGRVALEIIGGYVGWTLFEYWAHRFFFHLRVVGPKTARTQFVVHGVLHDFPWDEGRMVIPLGASLGICVLTYLAFRAGFGPSGMYGPFAGFVLGYILYDELHWYMHSRRPSSRFGKWLRREHFIHHFQRPTTRFGVSCPWLDYLFRSRD